MGRNLKWKTIRASVTGTSHLENKTECQDNCWVDTFKFNKNKEYLIAIVSDGAGSSINGEKGSELTCKILVESIISSLEDKEEDSLTEESVVKWIKAVRREIYSLAEDEDLAAREYACTVLCSVVAENIAIFFQIGDGAIVVSKSNILGVVFWPDSGEYANSTYFITDEDAISNLRVTRVNTKINEITLFSDGIQHLALSYKSRIPHFPFFDPMLSILQKRKNNNCDDLDEQLKYFLSSDAINSRTDDDKTLVLATRKQL